MSGLDTQAILTELREMRKEQSAANAELHRRVTAGPASGRSGERMSGLDTQAILTELREMRKEQSAANAELHRRVTDAVVALERKPCAEQARRMDVIEVALTKNGQRMDANEAELDGLKSFAWKVGLVAGVICGALGYAASWVKAKLGL